jgi:hypothetical protein
MTKKTAQENPPEVVEAVPSVSDEERSERWLRDSALSYALSLHKNNGGMTTAPQIVSNADVFLTFLKGE